MQSTALKQEILPQEQPLAVYDQFRAMIVELKETNNKTVFDYHSPKGNKEARSYIYKLRQSKTAIEAARKKEKAESLEYGRKVDAQAKELTAEIDSMIEVHAKPLEEIEEKERIRIGTIKNSLHVIQLRQQCSDLSSEEIKINIDFLKSKVIDDESFAEFKGEAEAAIAASLHALENQLPIALKREADQAELERLRKEKAESDQRERDKKIQDEAAEKARLEEQQRAQKEIDDANAKAAQAIRDKEDAEKRAKEAEENERKKLEEEQEKKLADQKRREEDEAHKAKVHAEIKDWLISENLEEVAADFIVAALVIDKIPHVKLIY